MACKYKYKDKWYSEEEVRKEISKDTSVDQVLTEFLSSMSYTVEINIAKENKYKYNSNNPDDSDFFYETAPEDIETENTNLGLQNTQHYSSLTVPGGTNYTENEITTPAIVPSIKGHAQFATSNGIGWFRSDESQQYQETDIQSIIDNLQKSGQLEINCK